MWGWVALVLAAVPLGLALVNLRLLRAPERAAGRPAVSVLIPARNEEANIAAACAAVLASEGVEIELVVLDDGSTDRTPAILAGIGDARLVVAAAPPLPAGWSGKQHACQRLSERASHELMVFVDADVRLAPDAVSRMAAFMARHPAVGLGSGFPRQVTVTWSEDWMVLKTSWARCGSSSGAPLTAVTRSPLRNPSLPNICRFLPGKARKPLSFPAALSNEGTVRIT